MLLEKHSDAATAVIVARLTVAAPLWEGDLDVEGEPLVRSDAVGERLPDTLLERHRDAEFVRLARADALLLPDTEGDPLARALAL